MSFQLPVLPSRDNVGATCQLVEADRDDLPDHVQPCECDEHHGVCVACGFKITVGPTGTEYGHARSRNQNPGPERADCPHRPASCDPNGPRTQQTSERGGSA